MSISAHDTQQGQDAITESIVAEDLDAEVVSPVARKKNSITEATEFIDSTSQGNHETSKEQSEDAGLQREIKTESEQVVTSVEDMNPQVPWNRGADTMVVAEILTAMRQGAFEPVRKSCLAQILTIREREPIRTNDGVQQTLSTRDAEIDQAADTLVAMSFANTSEAVNTITAANAGKSPTQPTAAIPNRTDVIHLDTEDDAETIIMNDDICAADEDDDIDDIDEDEDISDEDDDVEYLDDSDNDEHRQAIIEPPWLPHLRRKGGKGCREGCKACVAGIRRSEAGAGACDEDGRNITFSRP